MIFVLHPSEIFQTRLINRILQVFAVKSEEIAKFQYIRFRIKKYGENM